MNYIDVHELERKRRLDEKRKQHAKTRYYFLASCGAIESIDAHNNNPLWLVDGAYGKVLDGKTWNGPRVEIDAPNRWKELDGSSSPLMPIALLLQRDYEWTNMAPADPLEWRAYNPRSGKMVNALQFIIHRFEKENAEGQQLLFDFVDRCLNRHIKSTACGATVIIEKLTDRLVIDRSSPELYQRCVSRYQCAFTFDHLLYEFEHRSNPGVVVPFYRSQNIDVEHPTYDGCTLLEWTALHVRPNSKLSKRTIKKRGKQKQWGRCHQIETLAQLVAAGASITNLLPVSDRAITEVLATINDKEVLRILCLLSALRTKKIDRLLKTEQMSPCYLIHDLWSIVLHYYDWSMPVLQSYMAVATATATKASKASPNEFCFPDLFDPKEGKEGKEDKEDQTDINKLIEAFKAFQPTKEGKEENDVADESDNESNDPVSSLSLFD